MNFDRNTIIGVVLLVALLFVYLYISTSNSHELARYQKQQADSLARVKAYKDSLADLQDTAKYKPAVIDSTQQQLITGTEQLTVVENEVIRITFTNKGGQPKKVELKGKT